MPNTNPSDLDREALDAATRAIMYDTVRHSTNRDYARHVVETYINTLPRASGMPEAEGVKERIAELQYEAGVYRSLYENVINTAGYQKANTIGELAGWQWRPNGATVWRSDATVKWLDEQGDAIEKHPVFTAYPYDNGGDTLYDALESALWETPGWKDKIRAASALLTRTTFQTHSPIASEPKDAGSGAKP